MKAMPPAYREYIRRSPLPTSLLMRIFKCSSEDILNIRYPPKKQPVVTLTLTTPLIEV